MLVDQAFLDEQERLRAQRESNRVTTGDEFRSGARPLGEEYQPSQGLWEPNYELSEEELQEIRNQPDPGIRGREGQETVSTLSQQPSELLAGEGEIEQSEEVRSERLVALARRFSENKIPLSDAELQELQVLIQEEKRTQGIE